MKQDLVAADRWSSSQGRRGSVALTGGLMDLGYDCEPRLALIGYDDQGFEKCRFKTSRHFGLENQATKGSKLLDLKR